jgi:hypothetical protein
MTRAPRTSLHGQADLNFWRGQVWPRRESLLKDRHFWTSAVAAVILTAISWHLPLRRVPISTIALAALSYSAISFGACVTGTVLALTLPSAPQRRLWATTGGAGSSFTHMSELLFVFTWSAVCQLAVVIAGACAYVLGGNGIVGPADPSWTDVILVGAFLFVAMYAVLHLFTVVGTLSQLGAVSIANENAGSAVGSSADVKE